MADRGVSVKFSANTSGYEAGARKVASSTRLMAAQIKSSIADASKAITSQHDAMSSLGNTSLKVGAVAVAPMVAAAKAAVSWQTAWTGVTKTVNGSNRELGQLQGQLRDMAKSMPESHAQIAAVAESAGQLGVKTKDIAGFTKVMVELGDTTNLTSDEAATSLAQFMNIMGTAGSDVDRLGATIVGLGNNGASTEKDIVEMGQRIAGAGKQVGLSEQDVLAYANALASVGVNAEAGGTAMSQSFLKIDQIVREGGDKLDVLAKTSGVSAATFQQDWQRDAAGALNTFLQGLGKVQKSGGDTTGILKSLGMTGIRQTDSLRRLAGAGDLLTKSLDQSKTAWQNNTALSNEAGKRYATDAAKIQVAWNQITDSAITAGSALLPIIAQGAEDVGKLTDAFDKLPGPAKTAILEVVGALGLLMIGGGAILKVLAGIGAAKRALVDLGLSGRTMGAEVAAGAEIGEAGLTTMQKTARATGLVMKGVAAALIAVPATNAIFSGITKQSEISTTQVTSDLLKLSKQGKDTQNALEGVFSVKGRTGDFFAAGGGNQIIGYNHDINNLDQAFNRLFNRDNEAKANDWVTGITSHFGKSFRGTYQILKEQATQIDVALTQMEEAGQGARAEKAFGVIAARAARDHVSVQQLLSLFPQYRDSLQQQANDLKVTNLTAKDYADWMGGKIPAAIQKAIDAQKQHKSATSQDTGAQVTWAGAVKAATDAANQHRKSVLADRDALIASANAALAASNDQIAYKQAIADASKAIKDNKHTLDLNTQAGRDNKSALNNLAGASLAYIQDLIKNKASTDKVRAATKDARGEFIRTAEQMGATKSQAKKLADQYGLIPKKVATQVSAPGAQSVADQIDQIIAKIRDVHGKTVTVRYNAITGDSTASYSGGTNVAHAKASGGPIVGPGGPRDDRVPIMASNGEYMQTAAAHAYYGTAAMDAIRSQRVPRELLAGFASGGPININQTMTPGAAAAFVKAINAAEAQAVAIVKKHAQPQIPAGLSGGTSGANQKLGLALMLAHGWGQDQWPALKALWNGESGWNAGAYNASSGATGIPQALPGSKMASAGGDWRTNPATQIKWGLGYIASVYGSPAAAYGRWLSRSPHWYASGGRVVGPGGPTSDRVPIMASNGEYVVNAKSSTMFGPLIEWINAQGLASGGRVQPSRATGVNVGALMALIGTLVNPIQDLTRAADALHKAAAVSAAGDHGVQAAKRRLGQADDDLRAAKRAKDRKAIAAATKEQKTAQDAYNKALDQAKTKSDAYKTAQDNLRQAQQAVADAARSTSQSFYDLYGDVSKVQTITGLWKSMNQGATDLAKFNAEVETLRKRGLNETTIQSIIATAQSSGLAAGEKLATQAGNKGTIASLNKAAGALQKASDKLGYLQATGVHRASGGLVYGPGGGTDDRVPLMASNGEFVESEAAVRYYGLAAMRNINERRIPAHYLQAGPAARVTAGRAQPPVQFPSRFRLEGGQVRVDMTNGEGYISGVLVAVTDKERYQV